jgi:Helicase associated domain
MSKNKKSCMTQERIDMLDQLGFSWEVRPSLERPRATWQQRLEELTEYKEANGDFKIHPADMPQLHTWCHEQRLRLNQVDKADAKDSKKMTKERIEALASIGFDKDVELLDPLPRSELSSNETAERNSEAKDSEVDITKNSIMETVLKKESQDESDNESPKRLIEEATDAKDELAIPGTKNENADKVEEKTLESQTAEV